jgi:hypothetical protein
MSEEMSQRRVKWWVDTLDIGDQPRVTQLLACSLIVVRI